MSNKLDTMKPVIVTLLEADATAGIDAAGFRGKTRRLTGDLTALCWFGSSDVEFNSEYYLTRYHTLHIQLEAADTTRIDDAIERLDVMIKDLGTGGFFRTLYDSHNVIKTEHGRTVSALEDEGNKVQGYWSCNLLVRYTT